MARLLRAKWLLIPIVLLLIVGGYAAWQYFSKWESTDDAQVDGGGVLEDRRQEFARDDGLHGKYGDYCANGPEPGRTTVPPGPLWGP